jgi:transcription antitermination factor NusG
MQNNWYIIYTKPKWEKKVAIALKRRKIENFLPLQNKQIISFRRIKTAEQPLFENYVFVNLEEIEMHKLKNVAGIINIVYWKGKPAKIKQEEIEMLKDFIGQYDKITLQKTKIDEYNVARLIKDFSYLKSGNVLTIKNTVAKINLPSLGLTLVAKADIRGTVKTERSFGGKELLFES